MKAVVCTEMTLWYLLYCITCVLNHWKAQFYLKHFELSFIWKSWWFTETFWTSCSVFMAYQMSLTWRPGQCEGFKGIVHPNMKIVIICSPTGCPKCVLPHWLSLYKQKWISFQNTINCVQLPCTLYFFLRTTVLCFSTQWTNTLVQMTWTVHMDPTGYEMYITCARHNDSHKPEAYSFLHF